MGTGQRAGGGGKEGSSKACPGARVRFAGRSGWLIGPAVAVALALASGDGCCVGESDSVFRSRRRSACFFSSCDSVSVVVESKPSEVEGVEDPVSCSGKTSEGSWKGGRGHVLLGGDFLAGSGQFPRAQYECEVLRRGWGGLGPPVEGTGGEWVQEEQGAGRVLVWASVVETRGCTQCGGLRSPHDRVHRVCVG